MSVAELFVDRQPSFAGDRPAPTLVSGMIVMRPIHSIMTWNRWLIVATGASAVAMMVGSAQCLGSAASAVRSAPAAGAGFEQVAARRAYGYRARRAYGYVAPRRAIEYANPNVYRVGTRRWWAVMNRQGRDGRPD